MLYGIVRFCTLIGLLAIGLILKVPNQPSATRVVTASPPRAATADSCSSTLCRIYLPSIRRDDPSVAALAIQDGTIFAARNHTLLTYTIQSNGQPSASRELAVDRPIADLAVAGDHVFLLTCEDQTGDLLVVDGARTGQLTLRSSYRQLSFPTQLIVERGLAYVIEDEQRITVIDVADPGAPTLRSSMTPDGIDLIADIAIRNGFAYLAAGRFITVDLADPAHLREVGSLSLSGLVRTVALHDDVAYAGSYLETSSVVNIHDPSHLVNIGSYTNKYMYPSRQFVIGTTLFVAALVTRYGGCATAAYDITNPARVQEIELPHDLADTCLNDAVAVGPWLYVADRYRGLLTAYIGA